ncbi:hypothetical protein H5410_005662 [Solanum commersonii]|uniref:Uncharacterized protein n=1 Tax=Solanum commersonii TaxID=4109 RepID=A0A9J6A857_SOLCO|nr:hypothetical protein H5410_005662 [Solanum commersonii]
MSQMRFCSIREITEPFGASPNGRGHKWGSSTGARTEGDPEAVAAAVPFLSLRLLVMSLEDIHLIGKHSYTRKSIQKRSSVSEILRHLDLHFQDLKSIHRKSRRTGTYVARLNDAYAEEVGVGVEFWCLRLLVASSQSIHLIGKHNSTIKSIEVRLGVSL